MTQRGPDPARDAQVYLDCAATTPVDPHVSEAMLRVAREFSANPAAVHSSGIRAASAVELARVRIAERIGAAPEAVYFTSSATESNNLALKGAVWSSTAADKHIVISSIEHPSVYEVADWLAQTGQARVTRVEVDSAGQVSPDAVAQAITPDTVLVSVMHANNEIGTIQPVAEIAALCRSKGVKFHTDACQSLLKVPIDVGAWGIDMLTLNAHKAHGPKGVAALYVRPDVELTPLHHGGGHEMGMRSGTINVAGVVGFAETVTRYDAESLAHVRGLRQDLVGRLRATFTDVRVNGSESHTLPTVINFAIPGHDGADLAKALDRRGIRVLASSACHSTRLEPSHVLKAMGQSDEDADEALRVSVGRFNEVADLERLMTELVDIIGSAEGLAKASAGGR